MDKNPPSRVHTNLSGILNNSSCLCSIWKWMIHLWLAYFQEILGVVLPQTLVYTSSFELPQHGMYTKDDWFPGEMLVLVYDHDLLRMCLTILLFLTLDFFLKLDNAFKFQLRIMCKCRTTMMIQFSLSSKDYLPVCCFVRICTSTKLIVIIIFPNCIHNCIKTGLCIFIALTIQIWVLCTFIMAQVWMRVHQWVYVRYICMWKYIAEQFRTDNWFVAQKSRCHQRHRPLMTSWKGIHSALSKMYASSNSWCGIFSSTGMRNDLIQCRKKWWYCLFQTCFFPSPCTHLSTLQQLHLMLCLLWVRNYLHNQQYW